MELNINDITNIINELKITAEKNKDYLIELDAALGDGDLGITMVKAFKAAKFSIEEFSGDDIGEALKAIGFSIANEAAATMGTLTATAFIKGSEKAKGKKSITYDDIILIANEAIEGIKARGNAEVGDKTVLDCLVPALNSLTKAYEENKSLNEGMEEAYEAAKEGLEKTKELTSNFGRAHYYGEESLGKKDPGAAAAFLFIETINKYLQDKSKK